MKLEATTSIHIPTSRGRMLLRRKCACGGSTGSGGECEECKKKLQRRAVGAAPATAPPIVHEVLRSPGQPLDQGARALFEPRFGHDFSKIRVHSDERAAQSARAVNALAYTVGSNVVFGTGQYEPDTKRGQDLLAHELVHVMQQGQGPIPEKLTVGPPDATQEQEADLLSRGASLDAASPTDHESGTLRRQEAKPKEAQPASSCTPAPGIPSSNCSAYMANAWWLPLAYVNNATCACTATPNVPTANCVRKTLQDRLAATPAWLKAIAVTQKPAELNPATYPTYQAFVQSVLTPRIYEDHVYAYRTCCCPSGPAPYPDWIGVTLLPFQPCKLVGWFINHFGSCSGTPGAW